MRKKILGLLSDAAVYGASTALSQVIGLILLPLYTRHLSREDYGIVAMISLMIMLFVPIANLGMTNAIFRRFNVCRDERERLNVLTIGLASVLAGSALLAIVGSLAARPLSLALMGSDEFAYLVRWGLWAAFFNSVGAVPYVVLRAQRRVLTIAGFNLLKVLATILSTLVFLFGFDMHAEGVILGMLVGDLVCTAGTLALTARSYRLRVYDLAAIRSMYSYGLPFVPHNLQAVGLVMLGQYIVRTYLGLDAAGLYYIATKLALPVAFVVDSVQKAWVPYKFEIHAHDANPREFFRTVVLYYFAAISFLWLGVSLWGGDVLRLLTDPRFHAAAPLVPFVAAIAYARGLRFMLGTGMEFGDDMRPLPVVSFMGLVTVFLAALVLVPIWGAAGAAMATALAWLVMGALVFQFARRRYAIRYDWPLLFLVTATAVAFEAVGFVLQTRFDWPGRCGVALALSIAYPLVVAALLLRSPTERARLLAFAARFRGMADSRRRRKKRSVVSPPSAVASQDEPEHTEAAPNVVSPPSAVASQGEPEPTEAAPTAR